MENFNRLKQRKNLILAKEWEARNASSGDVGAVLALRAADRMAEIIDEMISDGQLNLRSRLVEARNYYGDQAVQG